MTYTPTPLRGSCRSAIALLALLAQTPAHAEEKKAEPKPKTELEALVVSALRTPREASTVTSAVTVLDRIYMTWRELKAGRSLTAVQNGTAPPPIPPTQPGVVERAVKLPVIVIWRGLFWTYDRGSWQYDVMVILILAFIWLTSPAWLGDPMAMQSKGLLQWLMR